MLCPPVRLCFFFFFFQAEDGIRDDLVTGVQTCALPIYDPRPPSAGHDCAGARRHDPRDCALLLVGGDGGGMGGVRRGARRRDGSVFVRHGAVWHAGGYHAVGDVARGGHGDPRVRLDPGAIDRLYPGAHPRAAAPRRGGRRSLSGLAGAGLVLRTGTARDLAAAPLGPADPEGAIRHSCLSRSRAGKRCRAASPAARIDRAMARRFALGVMLFVGAQHAAPLQAQRAPVLQQVNLPHAYYWREMYVPQVTSGPSAVTWSPDAAELIYSMQGTLWRQPVGSPVATQPPS